LDYFTTVGSPIPGSYPIPTTTRDLRIINDQNPSVDGTPYALIDGYQVNATTANIMATIDLTTAGPSGTDISTQFKTGNSFSMSVVLDIRYLKQASQDLDYYFSPIMIKYRW
jgi:hypothetical protein